MEASCFSRAFRAPKQWLLRRRPLKRRAIGDLSPGSSLSARASSRQNAKEASETRAQVERGAKNRTAPHRFGPKRCRSELLTLCLWEARMKRSPARNATGAAEKLPGAHADAALFAFVCPRERARMSAATGLALWAGKRLQWSHWPMRQEIANQGQTLGPDADEARAALAAAALVCGPLDCVRPGNASVCVIIIIIR